MVFDVGYLKNKNYTVKNSYFLKFSNSIIDDYNAIEKHYTNNNV